MNGNTSTTKSWASVINTNKNKSKYSKQLIVKYNVTNNDNTIQASESKDTIPRHKEFTPDPADDFIMTNNNHNYNYYPQYKFEYLKKKHSELIPFVQSLPYSLFNVTLSPLYSEYCSFKSCSNASKSISMTR